MENIKNKFKYSNQLSLIHNRLNKSNEFFDELNKINKITLSLELSITSDYKVIYSNENYNNKDFDYLIKAIIIDNCEIYNNLITNISYKSKPNTINPNNIYKLYHLSILNPGSTLENLNMIDKVLSSKNHYSTDINKDIYLKKINNHIDDFSNFVNKYNLPDDWNKIISKHHTILNDLYTTQLEYNKQNDIVLSNIYNNMNYLYKNEISNLKKDNTYYSKVINLNQKSIDETYKDIKSNSKLIEKLNSSFYNNSNKIYYIKQDLNDVHIKLCFIYFLLFTYFLYSFLTFMNPI